MFTKDGHKIVLKIKGGSHLYGLATENSDLDYIGVFLNTPEELYGLKTCEVIEENTISKQDNGKNDKDAIDCKYYSLAKFCSLALGCNPTILEILFVNPKNIVFCDTIGQHLLDNRHLFLSKKAYHSFLGYAISQKKKSFVKAENLKKLTEAYKELNRINHYKLCKTMLYDAVNPIGNFMKIWDYEIGMIYTSNGFINCDDYPNYITIGDLRFSNQKLIDVKRKIESRLNKASHRADGMLDKGVDYKFMSHTVRLLYEGIQLLTTGNISFPLEQKDIIMDIKLGKVKNTDIITLIEDLENKIKTIDVILPEKPDIDGVNSMMVYIYTILTMYKSLPTEGNSL